MTLPFEKPIRVYLYVTRVYKTLKVYVGQAYQNEHGYFADTDVGIMHCSSIEDAIATVSQMVDLEGRGITVVG